jgi:hypothetical protein
MGVDIKRHYTMLLSYNMVCSIVRYFKKRRAWCKDQTLKENILYRRGKKTFKELMFEVLKIKLQE